MRPALLLIVAADLSGAPSLSPHQAAIKQFASTMAIAQVASDRCADILVGLPILADIQARLGVGPADSAAVADEGRFAIDALTQAATEAPSVQAWCDAVYRLYGPDGTMIPNLMMRQK